MPEPKKDARITIRLTTTQLAALRAAAERRERSPNWLVRHILSIWLARQKRN